ncbi:linear amide C-N hydrolase [Planobispora takensis]|uniref:Choloylglycine hydrolase/NAAA C-terminal domain-containing protein n=1 Tax=Planobispora takensis TaxID=1367882 RepID=A0A8J3WUJ7_9ACTN|nr:linear amide C-N hydrolase [Planobispora takensis]GIH99991.1 hypothetical protein Pta02_20000 [Planobispora takensis]
MRTSPRRACAVLTALAVLSAGGCSVPETRQAAPPAATPSGPASAGATPRAPELLRQSAEEVRRTIDSMRRVDDLPLYEMTYYGTYEREGLLGEEHLAADSDDWACSVFAVPPSAGGGRPLFGRNFDWYSNPAVIVHADPPDGYASVSTVDLAYFLGGSTPPDLADPQDRRRMAHAVLAPFDGVNEKGLAVGMAAMPEGGLPAATAEKPDLGSGRIMRTMLDKAATVEEAVAIMRRYDVDFTVGPQIHYLIADARGGAVVVEHARGRVNVIEDRVLTNFTMTGTGERERAADHRYNTLDTGLPTARDWRDGMDLLRRVAQEHTRWSVVYDQSDGTARVVTAKRWDRVHTIPLTQR